MNATLVGVVIGGVIAAGAQVGAALIQDWLSRRREDRAVKRDAYRRVVELAQRHLTLIRELGAPISQGDEAKRENLELGNAMTAVLAELSVIAPMNVHRAAHEIVAALREFLNSGLSGTNQARFDTALAAFQVAARDDLGSDG